jgi:hypothetical protein
MTIMDADVLEWIRWLPIAFWLRDKCAEPPFFGGQEVVTGP